MIIREYLDKYETALQRLLYYLELYKSYKSLENLIIYKRELNRFKLFNQFYSKEIDSELCKIMDKCDEYI